MNISQKSYTVKFSNKGNLKFPLYLILLILLILSFAAALGLGSSTVNFISFIKALLNGDTQNTDYRIIMFIRLPRALGALLSGAALAVSGVIIQAVLNNPMAAPNIIGVNSGAGLSAVLLITAFPTLIPLLPIAAFLGAISACLLIYAISYKTGAGKVTITLVGIAISSILNAAINLVKTLFPDSVFDADLFLIGGLSAVTVKKLYLPLILISIAIILSIFLAKDIDIITLGDETSYTLGMRVKSVKLMLLVLAAILAGSAVSFAGLLGFVGLLVPHIARRFVGTSHRRLIPISAAMGSILVLLCDLFGRTAAAPYEISVGIILSFIGGPFFIALIFLQRRKSYDRA